MKAKIALSHERHEVPAAKTHARAHTHAWRHVPEGVLVPLVHSHLGVGLSCAARLSLCGQSSLRNSSAATPTPSFTFSASKIFPRRPVSGSRPGTGLRPAALITLRTKRRSLSSRATPLSRSTLSCFKAGIRQRRATRFVFLLQAMLLCQCRSPVWDEG